MVEQSNVGGERERELPGSGQGMGNIVGQMHVFAENVRSSQSRYRMLDVHSPCAQQHVGWA